MVVVRLKGDIIVCSVHVYCVLMCFSDDADNKKKKKKKKSRTKNLGGEVGGSKDFD